MQMRYQAALRPDGSLGIVPASALRTQKFADLGDDLPDFGRSKCRRVPAGLAGGPVHGHEHLWNEGVVLQPMAGAVDGEALLVEQVADAPDEQDFVVLVVAAVAAALDRLELREFLLPVTEHVRLNRTEVADLADGEIALGGDRR